MRTPYFLVSESKLKDNVTEFKRALEKIWPNSELGYSVKTNSLPWLLKYLKNENVMAEVVSDEEYCLAECCGYSEKRIIFNGPIKSKSMIAKALKNGSCVNIDSKNDLDCIKEVQPENAIIGIRLNLDPQIFSKDDIDYENDGFRFGFSEKNGEFYNAVMTVKEFAKNVELGLHLHCNSRTRSIEVYRAIARYVSHLICKYELKLSFIDFGGGFFGGVEGKPSAEEYIQCIRDELEGVIDFTETKLIIEPGSAIIGSVVDLYTEVVDVKDTDYARIVTTNGSRIHIDPLWKKKQYMYTLQQLKSSEQIKKQIICGYTCMDHDRLMTIEDQCELSIGDKIIYHRVGAYSMTFGGMFINYYPEVYVQYKDKKIKVRSYCDHDIYLKVHS